YPALLASGVTGKYVALSVSQATGVLVACLAGVHFGVTSLVIGLIINALVQTIPAVWILHHRIGLNPILYFKPCLAPACASMIMAGIIYFTRAALPFSTHSWVR